MKKFQTIVFVAIQKDNVIWYPTTFCLCQAQWQSMKIYLLVYWYKLISDQYEVVKYLPSNHMDVFNNYRHYIQCIDVDKDCIGFKLLYLYQSTTNTAEIHKFWGLYITIDGHLQKCTIIIGIEAIESVIYELFYN